MRRNALGLPYLVGLILLVGIPALGAAALAFTDFNAIQAPRFSGFDNFTRLIGDHAFWRAVGNSAVYVAIAVPVRLVAATALALLLHRPARGVPGARAAAFLPTVIPDAAFALLFLWILNPIYGPIAGAFSGFGIDPPDLLTDPWTTRVAIALMGAFQIGEGLIVALAARRSIGASLYDAAVVDGARPSFVLRKVTLPLMAPILVLLALRDIVVAFQVNFVPALLITDGGPRYATTYVPLYLYKTGFQFFRLGYASAMAVAMFAITFVVVYVQYRLARRWRLL